MQDHRDLDLNLLVVFDHVLRHRSVSRAALAAGLSQSTVSKALNKLRAYYGDPLFLKTRDGVAPTDTALALAPDVTEFVRFTQRTLVGRSAFDPATSERVITISVSDAAELVLAPPLMDRLKVLAPGCRIRALDALGREHETLQSGEVDLAIQGPIKSASDIRQLKLFEHVGAVLAHPDCPFEGEVTLEQLAGLDHVGIAPGRSDRASLELQLAKLGLERRLALTTSHWLMIPYVVARAPGCVAILPRLVAEIFRDQFGLKVLTPAFDLPKIEVFQYWHQRAELDPFNIWFRSLVKETFFKNASLHIRS